MHSTRRRPPPSAAAAALGAAALGLLGVGTVALAPAASAHDELTSAVPAAGAVVRAPRQVVLRFAEDVLAVGSRVVVTGPTGTTTDAAPRVDGTTLTQPLPTDLPGGGYTVTWRAVSSDGHPVSGTFRFVVAGSAPAAPPALTPTTARPADDGTTPATATATTTAAPSATATTAAAVPTVGQTSAPGASQTPQDAGTRRALLAVGGLAAVGAAVGLFVNRRRFTGR